MFLAISLEKGAYQLFRLICHLRWHSWCLDAYWILILCEVYCNWHHTHAVKTPDLNNKVDLSKIIWLWCSAAEMLAVNLQMTPCSSRCALLQCSKFYFFYLKKRGSLQLRDEKCLSFAFLISVIMWLCNKGQRLFLTSKLLINLDNDKKHKKTMLFKDLSKDR